MIARTNAKTPGAATPNGEAQSEGNEKLIAEGGPTSNKYSTKPAEEVENAAIAIKKRRGERKGRSKDKAAATDGGAASKDNKKAEERKKRHKEKRR